MRKKIATAAIIGGIGLTGGLLVGPGLASAADGTTSSSTGVSHRLTAIKDALKGLVADKTITQAQADKVATTLNESLPQGGKRGHGGPGRIAPAEVAKVLGITVEELRTQLQAGKTLAEVASASGVSKADLIDGLVKAEEAQLAQAVTDGKLTQAQADTIKSSLKERITARVDQAKGDKAGKGPRGGPREEVASSSNA